MKPVRWSNLRYMAECPAVYQYVLDNGVAVTPAMRFGSLVHGILLGFQYGTPVVFDGDRRGKAWTDFKAEHEGAEIVTADEWGRAQDCAKAVADDPTCGPLIRSGIKEHRIEWQIAGRPCAGTPDVNGDILLDLKVTPMTNPVRIAWHVKRMLWHAQLSWYANGIEANGGQIKDTYLVAVTPKPPHLAVAYWIKPETMELGTRQWRSLFERLRVCEESNQWPGYAQDVIPLGLDDDDFALTIDGEEFSL